VSFENVVMLCSDTVYLSQLDKALDIFANYLAVACTVFEIFALKLYLDLETGVWSHSRSLKVAPLDRPTPKTPH